MAGSNDPAICDSVGIRTLDPQIRNLLLYPAELRNRSPFHNSSESETDCKYTDFITKTSIIRENYYRWSKE